MASHVRAALVLLIVVGGLVASTGTATATVGLPVTYGFPTPTGSFVLVYSQGLLQPNSVAPGSLVFGDELYLQFINAEGNRSVTVSSYQHSTGPNGTGSPAIWFNESFSVPDKNVTVLTFDMPSSSVERTTRLCVDGGCETFQHLTPVTLIPSSVVNIGGLLLVVFGLLVEMGVLLFPLIVLARYLTRKALWSPKFRAWLWAPHIVLGFVLLLVADYRLFDLVFGGLAFILFPLLLDLLIFGWSLHLFNVARPVEILRFDPQSGHRLRVNRWRVWVGELSDGSKVLVGTRWRDWLARLFGHYPVLVPANAEGTLKGPPAELQVRNLYAPTRREMAVRRERFFRARPGRVDPLDDFSIAGDTDIREKNHPQRMYFVDSDKWLDADFPHLTIARTVEEPAVFDGEGKLVKPTRTRRVLTWPHYTGGGGKVNKLADIHYYDTVPAALGFIRSDRAYQRVETLRAQVAMLRASVFTLGDESAERQMAEFLAFFDREREALTEGERGEETRQPGEKRAQRPSDRPDVSEQRDAPSAVPKKGVRP